ncbi:TetR/AcrR family transcriptional regulator [Clostridium aminobutyricum]|uniref:TetR/AcrR family transcriptional regulator n=1 Tax=Clostridium aminobutyricum TaxID=33953 RepID=A0A939D9E4_CLOAM|nr:TetR/AcrR family transcriptional regulator [Clostridium aminobutyricum]MBN7773586.1 TetR/AcrR family transcriptional regulator [Clostridium aminobutyricum]
MDRRIKKSKEAIIDAFVSLMTEKNFDQITINEIADRANVNRGTVYLHYVDKYDLLDQCIETHLNQLFISCLPDINSTDFTSESSLLRTFEYLEQHSLFYSTMLTNKGVPAFRNRLLTMAVESLDSQIVVKDIHNGLNKEILIQFLASAAVGLLEWWITHSMPYPAMEMVKQFSLLLEQFQLADQFSDYNKS